MNIKSKTSIILINVASVQKEKKKKQKEKQREESWFLNWFKFIGAWLLMSQVNSGEQADINQTTEHPFPLTIIEQSRAKPPQSLCETKISIMVKLHIC